MNTVLPIAVIILLGALSGLAVHRRRWPFIVKSGAAALLATLVWCCGTNLLFLLSAPNELGFPLLKPLLLTFLTALVPAVLVCRAPLRKA